MEMQETPNGSVLKNKNKVGRFPLTELKTNSKETVIKTMWFWHKGTDAEINGIELSTEINPCIYGQLIFNKGAKTIQWA
jgi:hypothetical protein